MRALGGQVQTGFGVRSYILAFCRVWHRRWAPADRFLAATALVFELTLVTADLRLRQIPHVTVLANT